MGRWFKGVSGNPKGRPKKGTAIADLARNQIQKHKLIEKLGSMAAGERDYQAMGVDQQLRAIQLLLAYGYGPPRAEIPTQEGIIIQVNYVERNQLAINSAAPGTVTSDPGRQTLQCGLLRTSLGQDGSGDGSVDPPRAAG